MSKELNHTQQNVILEIIKSGNVETACKQVGITRQTYYNWLKQPGFGKELKRQQDEVYETSVSGMKLLFAQAVEAQQRLLNSQDERIVIRASNAIISNSLKVLEANSLKDRLNAIEKAAKEAEELEKFEGNLKVEFGEENLKTMM